MTVEAKETSQSVEPGSVDELARIIVLAMRYMGVPQGTLVHDLSALGLKAPRIAALLATKRTSVNAQKSQKRPEWSWRD